jgi:CBS domain-containing protein
LGSIRLEENFMKVGDVMSTGAAKIAADATLMEAVSLMVEHRISGLPVVDASGTLIGVVTEGDFMLLEAAPSPFEALASDEGVAGDLNTRRVEEIMTRDPVTVDVEAPLKDAIAKMRDHKIKRLPVLSRGRVVGILSRSDLLSALLRKGRLAAGERSS